MSFTNNSIFFTNNGVMTYTCDHCELVFSDKTELFTDNCSLINHMIVHSRENRFQCKLCSKTFKTGFNISRHILLADTL